VFEEAVVRNATVLSLARFEIRSGAKNRFDLGRRLLRISVTLHARPKVTQDSHVVVESDVTTKAMHKVGTTGLLSAWKKSNRLILTAKNLWHSSSLIGIVWGYLDEILDEEISISVPASS